MAENTAGVSICEKVFDICRRQFYLNADGPQNKHDIDAIVVYVGHN